MSRLTCPRLCGTIRPRTIALNLPARSAVRARRPARPLTGPFAEPGRPPLEHRQLDGPAEPACRTKAIAGINAGCREPISLRESTASVKGVEDQPSEVIRPKLSDWPLSARERELFATVDKLPTWRLAE